VVLGGVRVLDALTVTIPTGEHTAILGPNGSGKSTFMKLLALQHYPLIDDAASIDSGPAPIRVFGQDRWDVFALRARLGIVSADLHDRLVHGNANGAVTAADAVLSGFFATQGVFAHHEVTAEMRRRAKAVNFGIVYGQGDSGLAKSLGIPRTEAASFIAAYFRKYEGVRRFMSEVLESARAAGSIRTVFGRRRMVPDIRSENRARRLAAERIAMNTPIQGTAADLLKLAMLAFKEPPTPGARMFLTVHDELVFEVPEAEIDAAAQRIRTAMESVHPLEVPLVVDVGRGKNWSDAH